MSFFVVVFIALTFPSLHKHNLFRILLNSLVCEVKKTTLLIHACYLDLRSIPCNQYRLNEAASLKSIGRESNVFA